MQVNLQVSNLATRDDILSFHGPAVDVAGVGASALVSLAIAMVRVSALAALMSPLLLVVWLTS